MIKRIGIKLAKRQVDIAIGNRKYINEQLTLCGPEYKKTLDYKMSEFQEALAMFALEVIKVVFKLNV